MMTRLITWFIELQNRFNKLKLFKTSTIYILNWVDDLTSWHYHSFYSRHSQLNNFHDFIYYFIYHSLLNNFYDIIHNFQLNNLYDFLLNIFYDFLSH